MSLLWTQVTSSFEEAGEEARERRRQRAEHWLDHSEYSGGTSTGIPARWGPQVSNYSVHHIMDTHGWPRDESERDRHWHHLPTEAVSLRQPIYTHQGHVYPEEVKYRMRQTLHDEPDDMESGPSKFVRHQGDTFLLDGHHRFARSRLLGQSFMEGKVFDTSRPEDSPANCPDCRNEDDEDDW
jgi:hypothetical protein